MPSEMAENRLFGAPASPRFGLAPAIVRGKPGELRAWADSAFSRLFRPAAPFRARRLGIPRLTAPIDLLQPAAEIPPAFSAPAPGDRAGPRWRCPK